MAKLKVEGHPNLVRDTRSQAIINTDSDAYARYMARKQKQAQPKNGFHANVLPPILRIESTKPRTRKIERTNPLKPSCSRTLNKKHLKTCKTRKTRKT